MLKTYLGRSLIVNCYNRYFSCSSCLVSFFTLPSFLSSKRRLVLVILSPSARNRLDTSPTKSTSSLVITDPFLLVFQQGRTSIGSYSWFGLKLVSISRNLYKIGFSIASYIKMMLLMYLLRPRILSLTNCMVLLKNNFFWGSSGRFSAARNSKSAFN